MKAVRLALEAQRDLDDILAFSSDQFGLVSADRYRRLILVALRDLRHDASRPGVRSDERLPVGMQLYHLRHSRRRLGANDRVIRPRHFIVFGQSGDELVVYRLLHDSMDLGQHL